MCEFPLILKNTNLETEEDFAYNYVPCGKCPDCIKILRTNDWFVRLKYELKSAVSAHFVTLTYANPPISFNGHYTGVQKEFQDFVKRMRNHDAKLVKKKNGKYKRIYNEEISFYACLEYGTKYQRPHYHMILFNISDIRSVYKAWAVKNKPIGTIDVQPLNDARIKYVTGYVGKKVGIPTDDDDDRLPEFSVMSKGLGLSYLKLSAGYNIKNEESTVVIEGITYPLPRYLKNKIWPAYKVRKTTTTGDVVTRLIQHPTAKKIGKKNLIRFHQETERNLKLNPKYLEEKRDFAVQKLIHKSDKKNSLQ